MTPTDFRSQWESYTGVQYMISHLPLRKAASTDEIQYELIKEAPAKHQAIILAGLNQLLMGLELLDEWKGSHISLSLSLLSKRELLYHPLRIFNPSCFSALHTSSFLQYLTASNVKWNNTASLNQHSMVCSTVDALTSQFCASRKPLKRSAESRARSMWPIWTGLVPSTPMISPNSSSSFGNWA
eukprot:244888-Rhodomonas_salina.4